MPKTYSAHDWKCVPFDWHLPISPPPSPWQPSFSTSCLSIHAPRNFYCLVHILAIVKTVQWTRECSYLIKILISVLLDKNTESGLLGHTSIGGLNEWFLLTNYQLSLQAEKKRLSEVSIKWGVWGRFSLKIGFTSMVLLSSLPVTKSSGFHVVFLFLWFVLSFVYLPTNSI